MHCCITLDKAKDNAAWAKEYNMCREEHGKLAEIAGYVYTALRHSKNWYQKKTVVLVQGCHNVIWSRDALTFQRKCEGSKGARS